MNFLITLLIMTAPGIWEKQHLTFATQDKCDKAVEIFRALSPPGKSYNRWHEYLVDPDQESSIAYYGRCVEDK